MAQLTAEQARAQIRAVQKMLDVWTPGREEIVLATGAHESHLGLYMNQIGGGPAVGFFGMEPDTEYDRWKDYLSYRLKPGEIGQLIIAATGVSGPSPQSLITNWDYSCALATVKYLSCPYALPDPCDLQGLAGYWQEHYNAGTVDRRNAFISDYRRLILGMTLPGD